MKGSKRKQGDKQEDDVKDKNEGWTIRYMLHEETTTRANEVHGENYEEVYFRHWALGGSESQETSSSSSSSSSSGGG